MIESSIASQYGIRIRQHGNMSWNEFSTLMSGLMPDTPLGKIVSVRSEKDPETIKQFSPSQKKVNAEWRTKKANSMKSNPEKLERDMNDLSNALAAAFGPRK